MPEKGHRPSTTACVGTYPVEQPEQSGLHGPSALGEHRAPSLNDGVLVRLGENAAEGRVAGAGKSRAQGQRTDEPDVHIEKASSPVSEGGLGGG